MSKILTILGCGLAIAGFGLTANAQTQVQTVTPTPGDALSASTENIRLYFPDSVEDSNINVGSATATFKYDGSDGVNMTINPADYAPDPYYTYYVQINFPADAIQNALDAGASSCEIEISNLMVRGSSELDFSNYSGNVTGSAGTYSISYLLDGNAVGGGGSTQVETLEFGTPFTLGGSGNATDMLVPSDTSGAIYVATDTDTDLTEVTVATGTYTNDAALLQRDFEGTWMTEYYSTMVDGTEGKVYNYTGLDAGTTYRVHYTGDTPVEFTVQTGSYSDGSTPTEPESDTITPYSEFTISSQAPLWQYTPQINASNYYFKANDYPYDLFEDVDPWGPTLIFATDADGNEPIELTPVPVGDEYIYTGTDLLEGTTYYMILKDPSSTVTMTLYLEEYEAPTPAETITFGTPFEVSPDKSEYIISNDDDFNNEFYIVSDSQNNLLTNQELQILSYGVNFLLEDEITVVETEDGLIYAGVVIGTGTFDLKYTGEDTIELNIIRGKYEEGSQETDFMDEADLLTATLNSEYPVVEITWNQTVTLFDDEALITVNKNGERLTAIPVNEVYVQLLPGGDNEPSIDTRADLEDSGEVLNILLGAVQEYMDQGGAGTYTLMIPQGVFNNEDGKVNPAQSFTVEVVEYPVGTSMEEGTDFGEGDDVTIMISFEGKVEENPENEHDYVVMVFEGTGLFEVAYNVGDEAIELAGENIVVKLGEELPTGYYQLSIPEGALLIDGVMNGETTVNFSVGDPSAINSIGAELNGDEVIYNLNGVKLNKPVKGINIINGKKVIVR